MTLSSDHPPGIRKLELTEATRLPILDFEQKGSYLL